MYWSHTFEDLTVMTALRAEYEMMRAISYTESLLFTAAKVFGAKQSSPAKDLSSPAEMLAFAQQVNHG